MEFCFDIYSIYKGARYVDLTCLSTDHRSFEITAIEAGEYKMTAVLRSIEYENQFFESTRIVNTFSVVSYDDALPKIEIQSSAGDIVIAANEATSQADLNLGFALSNGLLDTNLFTTCVMLQDMDRSKVVVSWTCLKPTDRSIALNNLKIGNYELHMILRNTSNADTSAKSLVKSSEVVKVVRIKSLIDVIPLINSPSTLLEYGIDLHAHATSQATSGKSNVNIQYEVRGVVSAVQQLFLCVQVTKIDDSILLPFSCLSASTSVLTLLNMEIGSYTATLMLSVDQRLPLPSAESIEVKIDIRPMIEFIPSYDWQPLHAWHTIPSGIETRLPLSTGARKEARIPEPWRLQLTLPSPCKYFLRMDVMRDTTVAMIK